MLVARLARKWRSSPMESSGLGSATCSAAPRDSAFSAAASAERKRTAIEPALLSKAMPACRRNPKRRARRRCARRQVSQKGSSSRTHLRVVGQQGDAAVTDLPADDVAVAPCKVDAGALKRGARQRIGDRIVVGLLCPPRDRRSRASEDLSSRARRGDRP